MLIHTITDEGITAWRGMVEALTHRVNPAARLTENGQRFAAMSLLGMGRELLERAGVPVRGLARMELAGKLLQTRTLGTGDFPSLLSHVASKRLRDGYAAAPRTFLGWAREAPAATDFRPIKVVTMSGAPELLQVAEHGEFTYGTVTATGEDYQLLTFGRIVPLTRQALVNDDLRGFDRLAVAFGDAAARLENAMVYAQLTGNPQMADGELLFSGAHENVGAAALDAAALAAARTAIRVQAGISGEPLALAPRFLVVPAALEQVAYQLTSPAYVPATAGAINEFRAGGRSALEPVIEPLLDAHDPAGWYALAAPGACDTVEYVRLEGGEVPVIETKVDFSSDGMLFRVRHDFAAKAVDWRGAYRGGIDD